MKLTENEVVEHLCNWLIKEGWQILNKNIDHSRGTDIKAEKGRKLLIVKAKGARGNPRSHVTTRKKFDCGQIKTHLGKAIVKVLELKNDYPKALLAIAQPDDPDIRKCLQKVIPEITKLKIKLFWISTAGQVIEE